MAFVKAKLYLDAQPSDQIVELIVDDSEANEPLPPLPRSIQEIGHQILSVKPCREEIISEINSSHNSKIPNAAHLKVLLIKVQVKK